MFWHIFNSAKKVERANREIDRLRAELDEKNRIIREKDSIITDFESRLIDTQIELDNVNNTLDQLHTTEDLKKCMYEVLTKIVNEKTESNKNENIDKMRREINDLKFRLSNSKKRINLILESRNLDTYEILDKLSRAISEFIDKEETTFKTDIKESLIDNDILDSNYITNNDQVAEWMATMLATNIDKVSINRKGVNYFWLNIPINDKDDVMKLIHNVVTKAYLSDTFKAFVTRSMRLNSDVLELLINIQDGLAAIADRTDSTVMDLKQKNKRLRDKIQDLVHDDKDVKIQELQSKIDDLQRQLRIRLDGLSIEQMVKTYNRMGGE